MAKRLVTVVLLSTLLAGCALPSLTGTDPNQVGNKAPLVDPVTGKPVPNQPVEPLNGIAFKPLTQGAAQYLANNGGGMSGGSGIAKAAPGGMAATESASAPAPMADAAMGAPESEAASRGAGPSAQNVGGGAYSGNIWSYYSFGYYFGGYGGGYGNDQMALVSVQEATTKGSSGSFQSIVADIAAPVVKDWAKDARLIQSGAVINNDGTIYIDPNTTNDDRKDDLIASAINPWYNNSNAWRLVYVSSSRNEMLSFTVDGKQTTIIRMRWAPLDLDPARVSVDTARAVQALIKAIADKGFKGAEETSGKDYFMGYPFDQPKTGQWDGDSQKTEVLYDVPKNARWNVSLQQVMGKLVWDLNWYAYDEPTAIEPMIGVAAPARASGVTVGGYDPSKCAPNKQTNTYTNNNGQGMVDAETGTVIRFTRPTRVTYTYETGVYDCRPIPPPSKSPEPNATPTPTPTPTPTVEPKQDDEATGT